MRRYKRTPRIVIRRLSLSGRWVIEVPFGLWQPVLTYGTFPSADDCWRCISEPGFKQELYVIAVEQGLHTKYINRLILMFYR